MSGLTARMDKLLKCFWKILTEEKEGKKYFSKNKFFLKKRKIRATVDFENSFCEQEHPLQDKKNLQHLYTYDQTKDNISQLNFNVKM